MRLIQDHDTGPARLDADIPILGKSGKKRTGLSDRRTRALVERLRRVLLAPPADAERLHALFLGSRRTVLGDARLATGTAGTLSLRLRDLFARALALDASAIILAHNHPSGDCRPSKRDFEATHCVSSLAHALEIELLDHLIFTHDAVYSMRARGEL